MLDLFVYFLDVLLYPSCMWVELVLDPLPSLAFLFFLLLWIPLCVGGTFVLQTAMVYSVFLIRRWFGLLFLDLLQYLNMPLLALPMLSCRLPLLPILTNPLDVVATVSRLRYVLFFTATIGHSDFPDLLLISMPIINFVAAHTGRLSFGQLSGHGSSCAPFHSGMAMYSSTFIACVCPLMNSRSSLQVVRL
ncbi:hypothetical protein PR048_008750 [Dryococelus australis]|uniref:Uncharacterized protein n=1 Tax=Dryococelus australis TaxID=614101 RepID=A0ABQ9HYC6_9NEOP|nr:hypothetical protein PR048_008750 [Dryococelus australis]